ncbi:MAG: hypothetical protein K2X47_03140, partial [Bdellovibrionales bacterium]|nr:hypothetical protein [Bdellovibrionales bacterium]
LDKAGFELTSKALGLAARRMNQVHHAVKEFELIKGIRLFWQWGSVIKINPLVYVGGHIVEILAFETFSRLLEEPIRNFWDYRAAKIEMSKANKELFEGDTPLVFDHLLDQPQNLKPKVDRVKAAADRLRRVPLTHMIMNVQRFSTEANDVMKSLNRYRAYYQWIAEGLNPKQSFTDENGVKFNPRPDDFRQYLYEFFCADHPSKAVEITKKLGPWTIPVTFKWVEGIPVPQYSPVPVKLHPFRAIVGGAEKDIPKEVCDPATSMDQKNLAYRIRWARKNKPTELVSAAIGMVDKRLVKERNSIIEIYESKFRSEILNLFFGSVESLNLWNSVTQSWDAQANSENLSLSAPDPSKLPEGTLIRSLAEERVRWWTLHQKYHSRTRLFWDATYDNIRKSQNLVDVMGKILAPEIKSTTSEEAALFKNEKTYNKEDWTKAAKEFDSFVLD